MPIYGMHDASIILYLRHLHKGRTFRLKSVTGAAVTHFVR